MLGNSIFSTWTGTKLLWKCGNLIVNWVTLSSTNYTVPERLSSQSGKKYEIKKTSKISILQLFRELEKKNWRYNLGSYSKPQFSIFFIIGKVWEVQLEKHLKIPKWFCEFGKTWKCSLIPTLKYPNFESMYKLANAMS